MKNQKHISISQTGYGHYRLTMEVYGKPFSCITTDSIAIDDFRDRDDTRRSNRGYKALYRSLMREFRANRKPTGKPVYIVSYSQSNGDTLTEFLSNSKDARAKYREFMEFARMEANQEPVEWGANKLIRIEFHKYTGPQLDDPEEMEEASKLIRGISWSYFEGKLIETRHQ